MSEMAFNDDFPELFELFAGYYWDADLTDPASDIATANGFRSELLQWDQGKIVLKNILSELRQLMFDIGSRWKDVTIEANRYFRTPDEALVWLKSIYEALSS